MEAGVEQSSAQAVRFTHVRAWRVIGGIGMPPGQSSFQLVTTDAGTYSMEADADTALAVSDRGFAIGNVMLGGMFGVATGASADERMAAALAEIRSERQRKIGGQPVLLFVGHGETVVRIEGPHRIEPDHVVTFDSIDKFAIRDRYVHSHRSMQLALALQSVDRVRFDEVAIGTYCTDAAGRTVYSINISGNAELTTASPLAPDAVEAIARRFEMLNRQTELASTVRLFGDMASWGREPFRAFVSGWAALEILIKKTFKDYEEQFYGGLKSAHQPDLAAQFLKRARETLGRNLNVRDQFLAMSSVLLPHQSETDAQADLEMFLAVKKQRDDIAHGTDFDEAKLPVVEVNRLLTKYLAAHADRGRPRDRSDAAGAAELGAKA